MSAEREAEWTCEHGVVRGEGCDEYGCGASQVGHLCDWCEMPMTRSATDECANPEHRAAEPTLGLREAGCGCCVVVDRVALDSLRGVR